MLSGLASIKITSGEWENDEIQPGKINHHRTKLRPRNDQKCDTKANLIKFRARRTFLSPAATHRNTDSYKGTRKYGRYELNTIRFREI